MKGIFYLTFLSIQWNENKFINCKCKTFKYKEFLNIKFNLELN